MGLDKIAVGFGVNGALGVPALGWGALLFSQNIGGYQEVDVINDYRFNPNDGKWYLTSPSPDLG